MKNKVFAITGPSGVGKNFLINKALSRFPELKLVPAYTTRDERPDDAQFKNRIYVDRNEFIKMKNAGEFLEFIEYDNNFYGKRKIDFENGFKKGFSLILEIDTNGLSNYQKIFKENLVSIFICYESLEALEKRIITNRPNTDEADIKARYLIAKKEMERKDLYDYCIINVENHPEIATQEIIKIIKEKLK